MSTDCTTYQHPLDRDGTSQQGRQLPARSPDSMALIDLQPSDWLHLAAELASELRWHDPDNPADKSKNWQSFWPNQAERTAIWTQLDQRTDLPAHLALYLSFLELLEESRSRFNQLTTEHLDFYYQKILALAHQAPVGDQVHVCFELAKRITEQRLEAGSLLDGKKDGIGQARLYALEDELIVNQAQLVHLRQQAYFAATGLVYAPIANSSDGLGTPLPEDRMQWSAFGNSALPQGRIGWTLGAKELLLQEGERHIIIDIDLNRTVTNLASKISQVFQVFLTGEEGWVGPLRFSTTPPDGWTTIDGAQPKNRLFLSLSEAEAAIVPYQTDIHMEAYQSSLPLLQMILDDGAADALPIYEEFAKAGLNKLKLQVWVRGVQNLTLESDNGILDPSKPFTPFGPLPGKGNHFYVGSPEMFAKNWTAVDLHMQWQDRPASLKNHYASYADDYLHNNGTIKSNISAALYQSNNKVFANEPARNSLVTSDGYFQVKTSVRLGGKWQNHSAAQALFQSDGQGNPQSISRFTLQRTQATTSHSTKTKKMKVEQSRAGTTQEHNKEAALLHRVGKHNVGNKSHEVEAVVVHQKPILLLKGEQINLRSFPKQGFLRLQLQQHFFHLVYPELLALSKVTNAQKPHTPQSPYTPQLSNLKLDYRAETTQVFVFNTASQEALANDFYAANIQLFHDYPFGQAQEHPFLKWQQQQWAPSTNSTIRCAPQYSAGGSLFLGFENLKPNQQISLLLQFAEGSENPLRDPLTMDTGVKWSVLCANAWRELSGTDKLYDSTEQWLKSGIVRLRIPAQATTDNTLLENGFIWLKAELPSPLDRVCSLKSIHTQAAVARLVVTEDLVEQDRAMQAQILDHLPTGLAPTTIKALKNRVAGIQKVKQPYSSFGGRPMETDDAFYQRVSERLRHKGRGINIWDYEHLILEHFPEIYKVKCLSHSDVNNGKYLVPGTVSLVIIPKTDPNSAFDRLQPRAGRQLRNAIDNFLTERISKQIQVVSVNPVYETVTVTAKIAFRAEYDAHFYLNQLQEDLRVMLSPWAGEAGADISFGGRIYRTGVVRFLESLPYVDFIADLNLEHKSEQGNTLSTPDARMIKAATAASILVSAATHNLSIIQNTCS